MSETQDSEISALTHLLKAHLQTKTHILSQTDFLRIRRSYFASNQSWKIIVELLQKIKKIKQSYLDTKKQINLSKWSSERKHLEQNTLASILNGYQRIAYYLNATQSTDTKNCHTEHEIQQKKEFLAAKQEKLNVLIRVHQENSAVLRVLNNKNAELDSRIRETIKLQERLVDLKGDIQIFELKKLKLSTNSFKHMKNANILGSLSKQHLKLRSKHLLKEEIQIVLANAQEEYERYGHFLKLEKRKLQKLKQKNKSQINLLQVNKCKESTAAGSSDSWRREGGSEIFFSEINPIQQEKRIRIKNFSEVTELDVETIEEILDIGQVCALTSSVREANLELQERIKKISKNTKFVFT